MGNMMNTNRDINLSTIFRRNLDLIPSENVNIKQEFLNEKYEKTEHRDNVFLADQKYTLSLDELI